MILGMSNTYQQLVTSLEIGDLKHTFETIGDSRVGTNSPFNIRHKRERKTASWVAWALLVITSIPIHFLANSLIGPSYIGQTPQKVSYRPVSNLTKFINEPENLAPASDFICWSAFLTGRAHLPEPSNILSEAVNIQLDDNNLFYQNIVVGYTSNCSGLANSTSDVKRVEAAAKLMMNYYDDGSYYSYKTRYWEKGSNSTICSLSNSVWCYLTDPDPPQCRLNVRMNAAFILLGALTFKAAYMIWVNLMARGRLKRQLLTFGDVIVASASNPEFRVQGECMVNAREAYRRSVSHTCHKHCKSTEISHTGDELGHCQICKKWNRTNRLTNEPQPTIATKIKRSLISNLGNTAITQMVIMMFCCLGLLAASLMVAITIAPEYNRMQDKCNHPEKYSFSSSDKIYCAKSNAARMTQLSGGWGGFNKSIPLTTLGHDKLSSEMLSFAIANGAQFFYSLLYLLMIYNVTLISQEYDWGALEHNRGRLRCTIVKGESFDQSYLLQLPKKILFPIMTYSILTHWMLGEALQTQETIWMERNPGRSVEHSLYAVTTAAYPLWMATFLIFAMMGVCWWAFTYRREGFIPQMFGSMRVLCAATTQLDDFPTHGVKWGDLGEGKRFRHAGFGAGEVSAIVPNEVYAGIE